MMIVMRDSDKWSWWCGKSRAKDWFFQGFSSWKLGKLDPKARSKNWRKILKIVDLYYHLSVLQENRAKARIEKGSFSAFLLYPSFFSHSRSFSHADSIFAIDFGLRASPDLSLSLLTHITITMAITDLFSLFTSLTCLLWPLLERKAAISFFEESMKGVTRERERKKKYFVCAQESVAFNFLLIRFWR